MTLTTTKTKIGSIMLIDDNKIDQMMYDRIIKRSGVVETTMPFFLATDALEYLKSDGAKMPDLILLDINMPRMDGFEFLEAAVAAFGDGFAPVVVMLTTSLDPKDEARAGQFSVVRDYLNKPLTDEHLAHLMTLV